MVHEVRAESFVAYLRQIEVAPNGHPNSAKRHLRDKGIQFILETCRAMFAFAGKRRHLPPYSPNPFAELPLDHLKIENAKPIFIFDQHSELAFFQSADPWSLPIHALLAKTGLRVGEVVHLLIEDTDLTNGWLRVRNKPSLGWRIKTGNERNVPLIPEIVYLLRQVIGAREAGLVFLRPHFLEKDRQLSGLPQSELEKICQDRRHRLQRGSCRKTFATIAAGVWREAGAVKADAIRTSFIRLAKRIGHSEATCPKSWQHTFATLLQDANVDPLIRQITLGHRPTTGGGLGMTAAYTHTRPDTQREQIEKALRLWPRSLAFLSSKEGSGS